MSVAEKAREFLRLQQGGDLRCKFLLVALSLKTGLSIEECQRQIEELAE